MSMEAVHAILGPSCLGLTVRMTAFQVYGVRKVWRQLVREGRDVARCTVARLMKTMGLQGVIRGRRVRTTISDKAAPCPLDRVNRQFKAPRPNVLWSRTSHMSPPGRASSMWRS
jgi:transposase InsO family protein